MTREPFTPEKIDSNRILDSNGHDVGELLATEGRDDEQMRVVMRLSDQVRAARRVYPDKVAVPMEHMMLENGQPRLDCTLDDLLDMKGAPHSNTDTPPGTTTDRPPHFGAPADRTKAPQSESTRSRGDKDQSMTSARPDPRRAD